MLDYETTVSGIEFKARQLAGLVEELRRAVDERDVEIMHLNEALKNKEEEINKIKEQNKLIKLGTKLTEGNDGAELKLKINQMIRAIDHAITMTERLEA